jgi:hypothetical protein
MLTNRCPDCPCGPMCPPSPGVPLLLNTSVLSSRLSRSLSRSARCTAVPRSDRPRAIAVKFSFDTIGLADRSITSLR